MTKSHCNICDKTPAQNARRLWANRLPAGHPLRNVCMDIKLVADVKWHGEEEFDLCDDCFGQFIGAICGRDLLEAIMQSKQVSDVEGHRILFPTQETVQQAEEFLNTGG